MFGANKDVRHIEVFAEAGETEETARKRYQKIYNITDDELKSGKVKIKVLDQYKVFPLYKNYKKK